MEYVLNIQFYFENTDTIYHFYKVCEVFKFTTIIALDFYKYSAYMDVITDDPIKELKDIEKEFGDEYPITKGRILREGIHKGKYYESVKKMKFVVSDIRKSEKIIYDRKDIYLIRKEDLPFEDDDIFTVIYDE